MIHLDLSLGNKYNGITASYFLGQGLNRVGFLSNSGLVSIKFRCSAYHLCALHIRVKTHQNLSYVGKGRIMKSGAGLFNLSTERYL